MGYYGYHDDTTFILVMMSVALTLLCCLTCPGEGLMFIGLLKLYAGAALTGRTGDPMGFIVGISSCFFWFQVGMWKIKKRREEENREEQIAASSLGQISYGRDGDSGVTASTPVVATNDCDGDQEMAVLSATSLKATSVVAAILTTSSNYEKVNTEESSNIV